MSITQYDQPIYLPPESTTRSIQKKEVAVAITNYSNPELVVKTFSPKKYKQIKGVENTFAKTTKILLSVFILFALAKWIFTFITDIYIESNNFEKAFNDLSETVSSQAKYLQCNNLGSMSSYEEELCTNYKNIIESGGKLRLMTRLRIVFQKNKDSFFQISPTTSIMLGISAACAFYLWIFA